MNDEEKVKILIEMDKETYGFIRNLDNLEEKEGIFPSIAAFNTFIDAVRDGKIVEVKGDLIDRSELEKESVLDKIKAEIRKWYWQADKQAIAKDPCVVDAMIDLFIRTIDKYKAESEEKRWDID